jgi:hypothetical protein
MRASQTARLVQTGQKLISTAINPIHTTRLAASPQITLRLLLAFSFLKINITFLFLSFAVRN